MYLYQGKGKVWVKSEISGITCNMYPCFYVPRTLPCKGCNPLGAIHNAHIVDIVHNVEANFFQWIPLPVTGDGNDPLPPLPPPPSPLVFPPPQVNPGLWHSWVGDFVFVTNIIYWKKFPILRSDRQI